MMSLFNNLPENELIDAEMEWVVSEHKALGFCFFNDVKICDAFTFQKFKI